MIWPANLGGKQILNSEHTKCLSAQKYCLYALAASLPLSIFLSQIFAYASVGLWLFDLLWNRRLPKKIWRPFIIPVVLFVGIALFSCIIGVRPFYSLSKTHRLIFLGVIFLIPDLNIQLLSRGYRSLLKNAVLIFIAASCVHAAYDLIRIPWAILNGQTIYGPGSMRDPQMYLTALAFIIAIALFSRSAHKFTTWIGPFLFDVAAMILHFKRGIWLSFIVVVTFLGLFSRQWKLILLALLCTAGLSLLPPVRQRWEQVAQEWTLEEGGRCTLWTRVAPAIIADHPLGMGYRSTRNEDLLQYSRYVQRKLSHLHNNALQITLELGWPGLAVWALWMITTIVVLYKNYKESLKKDGETVWLSAGCLCAFLGLMANGMVEYNFGAGEIFMLLCLIMGIGNAESQRYKGIRASIELTGANLTDRKQNENN